MKISYLDLLNALRKGKQPKQISIYGHEYTWDGADYVWEDHRLGDVLHEWTPIAQAKVGFIEADENGIQPSEQQCMTVNSDDLISRKQIANRVADQWYLWGEDYDIDQVLGDIEDAPSVEAEPVRHGRWKQISPAGIYECSVCGHDVMTSDIEVYEYCHQCGAKMNEEKEE